MSDHDNSDEDDIEASTGFSLSSILFGNVNKDGELIDDIFGKETSEHIKKLDQLDIASGLIEELKDDVKESISDAAKNTDDNSKETDKQESNKTIDDKDFDKKDDDAIDYSDINEMVDDSQTVDNVKHEDDTKFMEALSELVFKMPTAPISKPTTQQQKKLDQEDKDYDSSDNDKSKTELNKKQIKNNLSLATTTPIATKQQDKTLNSIVIQNDDTNKNNKKRLDTPLAEMLPTKYENCDVTELFPEFRPNKTLRFSRLFGSGKSSLMPNPWKSVKNKKRKKKRQASESFKEDNKDVNKESTNEEETALKPSTSNKEFSLKFAETFDENDLEEDDEEFLKRPLENKDYLNQDEDINGDLAQKIAHLKNGPAAYWYSEMFAPEGSASKIFDLGFKKQTRDQDEESSDESSVEELEDDAVSNHSLEDCYHMVTQGQWEDEIIWSGEECKQKILAKNSEKYNAAGWIPSGQNRTATSYIKQVRGLNLPNSKSQNSQASSSILNSSSKNLAKDKNKLDQLNDEQKDDTWYSIFPAENEELIYGVWEGDVIWDAENLSKLPEPKVLTLDPNDENIVLGIPDDIDPNAVKPKEVAPIPLKEKKEHHLKKSRILLGKAGVIAEPEPESPPPPEEMEKDPYNISNDEFYNPKLQVQNTAIKPTVGVNLIQHSIPALELRPIFFPTYMGPIKLRSFHRPPLKRYSHGAIADSLSHPVIPLLKHMKKKAKQREQERLAAGGGDMFFMRTPEDCSGKDGDLILCEYSEEHPPLMNQIGMATKIKNYYKRRLGKDSGAPEFKYGETIYAHTTPFLGNLAPGQSLQAFENNLYRAPIYKHNLPETDFLVIRTRNNYFIRNVETIFTVGQELPLYEVPGPNSKKANNFIRDFLQVFIYRLFWSSTDTPRRIKMEDIKKAFPSHSESSIRKRLKLCADFKRTGLDSNWWVLKNEFRLPTEEEMRALVSPEQCCAYYSMIAAEQRLKDAGYGEKTLFTADDDNDEDLQLKMDDEVKTAPWNTTRAFIAATKGKCLLQLNGPADPTGCGEGFSYIRIPNKPQISKEDNIKQQEPKKTVTGTDADLRRLPLSAAKNLLRKHNVPEEEIKKLSRWEVIDVVRTLSTAQAKAGAETMSKFARGNRFSIAEHQERYKEEAQRIFELQNRLLGSIEELSTDEDDELSTDEDIEEMGKNIENIIANKKTSHQLTLEKEEEERRELRKLLMGEESNQGEQQQKNDKNKQQQQSNKKSTAAADADNEDSLGMSNQGKLLKIYRTYLNADGKEYIRIETVRKPAVITAYVKLRQTKDPEQIKKFTHSLDEQEKEEYRKVKRRIQEQLRRLKRAHERQANQNESAASLSATNQLNNSTMETNSLFDESSLGARPIGSASNSLGIGFNLNLTNNSIGENSNELPSTSKGKKEKKEKEPKKETKVRCGNCGQTGHMKTNKICPMYTGELAPIAVAMTEAELQEQKETIEQDNLIKIDDTKITFSKQLIMNEEEIRKKSLILKVPKDVLKRKRRGNNDEYCDYLDKPEYKQANRRRKDPLVSLSIYLEQIVAEIKQMESADIFWLPVSSKKVKDYYNIITKPMDIQTIKKKVSEKQYKSREEFVDDWTQIHENSRLYNGLNHPLTLVAQKMLDLVKKRLEEKNDKIAILERTINPLLDNDQVALSFILESIVLPRLRNVTDSYPFHHPVNKKNVKNYYDIIKNPIDLETIALNVKEHKYPNRQMFLNDIELMYKNCVQYNGEESSLSKKAYELLEITRQCLEENDEKLKELENSIMANIEAALDADDSESVGTTGLSNPDEMDDNDRSDSRNSRSKYFDNQSDYDENSQSGLVINQEEHVRRSQEVIQYEEMMIENNEEEEEEDNDQLVDIDYDPSAFLRERFNTQQDVSDEDEKMETSSRQDLDTNSKDSNKQDKTKETTFSQQQQREQFEQDLKMSSDEEEDGIWF